MSCSISITYRRLARSTRSPETSNVSPASTSRFDVAGEASLALENFLEVREFGRQPRSTNSISSGMSVRVHRGQRVRHIRREAAEIDLVNDFFIVNAKCLRSPLSVSLISLKSSLGDHLGQRVRRLDREAREKTRVTEYDDLDAEFWRPRHLETEVGYSSMANEFVIFNASL